MASTTPQSIVAEKRKHLRIDPTTRKHLADVVKDFSARLKKALAAKKISATPFVGGSFAKKTLVAKDHYDIDVFVRFDSRYRGKDISSLCEEALKSVLAQGEDMTTVHGSRDYFQVRYADQPYELEIIPVLKVSHPRQAENITDLSYSHVRYISQHVKDENILADIGVAKVFCAAHHCYGAESYIQGFSGYALELLVAHYKGFIPFLKAMVKVKKGEKLVIDSAKHYPSSRHVLMDVNGSKLLSPVILIDPVYPERNALAALSEATFTRFVQAAKAFLARPSLAHFEERKTDIAKVKTQADKQGYEFVHVQISTDKQPGDIAGSKLLKFYGTMSKIVAKYFDVRDQGFNYNRKSSARYYFVARAKESITIPGPEVGMNSHVKNFEKAHKNYFTQKGRLYATEPVTFSLHEFMESFSRYHQKLVKDMSITAIRVLD